MANVLKASTIKIGNSATVANNFTLNVPATPNGTLLWSNAAATPVTLLTIQNLAGTAPNQTTTVTLTKGQLQFPATNIPSSEVCVLDDYEEGTFTPLFSLQFIGTTSFGVQTGTGKYTKIGKMVTCHFSAIAGTYTAGTGSGSVTITGLPFVAANLSQGTQCGIASVSTGFVTNAPRGGFVSVGSATFLLTYRSAGSINTLLAANCATGMSVYISLTYFI